jgi:hypothetical protein
VHVSYDGMVFDVLLLKDWLRESVLDESKTTFLHWHHIIDVECVLNVNATVPNKRLNVVDFGVLGKLDPPDKPLVGAPAQRKRIKPNLSRPRRDIGGEAGLLFGGGLADQAKRAMEADFDRRTREIALEEETASRAERAERIRNAKARREANIKERDRRERIIRERMRVANAVVADGISGETNIPNVTPTIPVTNEELQRRLMMPRRQLLVWMYSGEGASAQFMLVSPLTFMETDALHGPVCTIVGVQEITGVQTAIYSLRFETWVGPKIEFFDFAHKSAPPNSDKAILRGRFKKEGDRLVDQDGFEVPGLPIGVRGAIKAPALICNRWEMSFGWDTETHLRTQIIEGEALFRMDLLKLKGLTADSLRGMFWHPIPFGYVRRPEAAGDITLSSGGDGVKYKIIDDEAMMNFPGGAEWGCIHIEATTEFNHTGSAVTLTDTTSDEERAAAEKRKLEAQQRKDQFDKDRREGKKPRSLDDWNVAPSSPGLPIRPNG